MFDVAKKHQMKIARDTLKMNPAMVGILGGMNYETAYKFIFNTDLKPRLESLIAQYGENPAWLSWELDQYGWTPKSLLDALNY